MLQRSLFGGGEATFDRSFDRVQREHLDARSWIDHAPGWVSGADTLFEQIVADRNWKQRTRRMHTGPIPEPRLTAPWRKGMPLLPALEEMRLALSGHYGVEFDTIGFNLYRDGHDSVAWHGDHIDPKIAEPVVVLVSLGEPRKFLLRPAGGGASRTWLLGRGDLLVTGGRTQREWEHSVPKVAHAGPRISLAFRYGMDARRYGLQP